MRTLAILVLASLAHLPLILPAAAAIYHTSPGGDDLADGGEASPWRTIQRAVNGAQPGDTVIVSGGAYDERVTTVRGGTGADGRIHFRAEPTVVMRGWRVHHPFITIDGFDITGHSHSTSSEGFVRANSGGDQLELLNCTVRDGIKVVDDAIVFTAPDKITVPSGGLLAAGFAPGQAIVISRGSPTAVLNTGGFVVATLTDTELTLNPGTPVTSEGPVPAYIAAASPYGLHLDNGAAQCIVRGNTFRNLAFDTWFIMGSGHLLENNLIEQTNGWDAMHFGGTGHIFRYNTLRSGPLVAYQNSPDAFENYTPIPYANVTFHHNFVQGFTGVLASQKGSNTSNGLLISRNVFVDVGRFSFTHPGTTVEHNTFLRVARHQAPGVARASHPLFFSTTSGATNGIIRNNVFVDCGEPSTSQNSSVTGWYEIGGPSETISASGNFVSGPPAEFAPKSGWPETNPLLNGGNPGFLDSNDPVGPDGVPFTEDDGLRLLPTSKLIGQGSGAATPGAYAPSFGPPELTLQLTDSDTLLVSWPETDDTWTLQTSPDLSIPWDPYMQTPTLNAGRWTATSEVNNRGFFRLLKFTAIP